MRSQKCQAFVGLGKLFEGHHVYRAKVLETFAHLFHPRPFSFEIETLAELDLASEVFTRAFANIHRYRWQGKSFLAWLYTIARNAVTDRRRRQRPTVDLENAFGLAEDGPTAHEHAVRGEEVDALRGAVKHLTTEQQEVLVLRFVENMSSRQVANMLGKNEGAIRALQFRALGRLRKLMTTEVA